MQGAGQLNALQTLVERVPKCQRLQGAGQLDSLQTLVEVISKCQRLQRDGQLDPLQTLVELVAKCQRLQGAGQLDTFQTLEELVAKRQRLQSAGQLDPLQALVQVPAKGQGDHCVESARIRRIQGFRRKHFLQTRCGLTRTDGLSHVGDFVVPHLFQQGPAQIEHTATRGQHEGFRGPTLAAIASTTSLPVAIGHRPERRNLRDRGS